MTYNDQVGKLLEDVDAAEANKYVPDATCFLRPVVLPGDGRFVVQQDEPKAPSKLIYLPQKQRARPTTGRVIAVTPGWEDWLGRRILFGMMSGIAACFKNKPFWLVLSTAEVVAEITQEDAEIDQDNPLPLEQTFA